jgi:hypothetical protein
MTVAPMLTYPNRPCPRTAQLHATPQVAPLIYVGSLHGPDPDPSPGQLAYLVVACGLLGLFLLGSYREARRYLQRSSSPRVTADHDLR